MLVDGTHAFSHLPVVLIFLGNQTLSSWVLAAASWDSQWVLWIWHEAHTSAGVRSSLGDSAVRDVVRKPLKLTRACESKGPETHTMATFHSHTEAPWLHSALCPCKGAGTLLAVGRSALQGVYVSSSSFQRAYWRVHLVLEIVKGSPRVLCLLRTHSPGF